VNWITVFLIFFPLAAALLVFTIKSPTVKWLAFSAGLIELAGTVIVLLQFQRNETVQFAINIPWITSLGLNFSVGIDGISLPLVLLTNLLTPLIILSAFERDYAKPATFYGLILMMQMALVGVFVARDGLLFYLFWEMALIPIYFICLIWGGEKRGKITLKFFIYTLAGSLFMLLALVYIYLQTPNRTFEIEALYETARMLGLHDQNLIFWAMFIAFAIKIPVFPFHTWQPDTYTVAPTQGTMLLSGIMLKMGLFGLIRWMVPLAPMAFKEWHFVVITLGVIGVIYGSVIALVQKDYKRLIAYSSIAHVGLIAAGLLTWTTLGVQGAMIQMLSHGIIAVGLFFIVDVISHRTQSRSLDELGGIRNVAPVLASVFIVVMLGSVALPLTSGFIGEFLLINSLFQYHQILGAVAGLTIILGAVYMLVAFQRGMSGETNTLTSAFKDLTLNEKCVLFPIVLLILAIGIYPNWLLEISEPAVKNLIDMINQAPESTLP
jgi:NADH-quinone oxidoreductase subunit M